MLKKILNLQDAHQIRVTPRAKKTEYVGLLADGTIKIRLAAAPEDGAANRVLLEFLFEQTGQRWEIIRGTSSQNKMIRAIRD